MEIKGRGSYLSLFFWHGVSSANSFGGATSVKKEKEGGRIGQGHRQISMQACQSLLSGLGSS